MPPAPKRYAARSAAPPRSVLYWTGSDHAPQPKPLPARMRTRCHESALSAPRVTDGFICASAPHAPTQFQWVATGGASASAACAADAVVPSSFAMGTVAIDGPATAIPDATPDCIVKKPGKDICVVDFVRSAMMGPMSTCHCEVAARMPHGVVSTSWPLPGSSHSNAIVDSVCIVAVGFCGWTGGMPLSHAACASAEPDQSVGAVA